MSLLDWLTVVVSLLSIISICANIIQWKQRRSDRSAARAKAQATFNVLGDIKYLTNLIFRSARHKDCNRMESDAAQIKGLCRAAMQEVVAYSRENLDFLPSPDLIGGKIADAEDSDSEEGA